MSARELARVEVLGRVKAGTLQVREAATLLDVSERQAKRLWQRFKTGGAAALRHRQVGRPSNRGRSDQQREQVLRLIREKYNPFWRPWSSPRIGSEQCALRCLWPGAERLGWA